MKLFAHFDTSGKIHSLTSVNAPDGISLMLTPSVGRLVAEVEGHGLGERELNEKALRELAKSHIIAEPLRRYTLVKKGKKPRAGR
jgi:hypothetical protein